MATGRDTAALSAWLGVHEYAVLGISGGGPFAVATAVADPDAVRALAVVGGVGPWLVLDEPAEEEREYRAYLAMFDAGDKAGAWEGLSRLAEKEMGGWRALDDDARVNAILDEPQSPLAHDNAYRALWARNMNVVLGCLDGYVNDNLAWGGTWDVDPADVAAPTVLWDADGDGARHVRWYADQIAGSELVIFPGEGHLDVCDRHWPRGPRGSSPSLGLGPLGDSVAPFRRTRSANIGSLMLTPVVPSTPAWLIGMRRRPARR